ncbi:MAG: MarR family transcriptional regulator [Flavobacteriales bacterium]|jgi:DNA-binding MarR family transcriptional regulator|nr:MarR family transcriptional regulator [Flavobacteriales bacterium]|tara:strand:+ start:19324 stop:19752 length:429 start_codon:yes stop_codon:yes gene_type:complete
MEQEETIDYNIRKTWYNITKMYNRTAIEYMGSMALAMILLNIDMYEGTPSTQLGPNMGMEATSLSRSLKKLEKLGVIKRVNDKIDKRKVIIKLTKLGLNRREIAKKTVLNFNNKIFSEINEQEKEVFFAVLNKINKLINNIK